MKKSSRSKIGDLNCCTFAMWVKLQAESAGHECPRLIIRPSTFNGSSPRGTDWNCCRNSDFRTRCTEFRRLWARGGAHPAHTSWRVGSRLHRPDQPEHHHLTDHCLFLISPDDSGIPW